MNTYRTAFLLASLLVMLLTSVSRPVQAQNADEIEVYSTEMAPVKSLLVELHSNYIFRGRDLTRDAGGTPLIDDRWLGGTPLNISADANDNCTHIVLPLFQRGLQGTPAPGRRTVNDLTGTPCVALATHSYAEHETIEMVTGLTSWSELGGYVFTSEQKDPVLRATGGSLRYKVRAPGWWRWPVNVAFSTELEYDNPRYSSDTWSWELRPVIDKAVGRWFLSINPTLDRTLQGTGGTDGFEFSPSAKGTFDFTNHITGGVEYYGAFGTIGDFDPARDRLQQFFGVVDLHVSPLWEVNFGVGTGTTPATDHLVAKMILGRQFSWN